MVLARLWRWFPGWVRVQAEGGYPERLLNRVAQEGLSVWHTRRREETLYFSCFARDYRQMRPLARYARARMRVRRRHGLPFWLFRYRRRKGLLVGFALYVLLLALLSSRIWIIDVVGNDRTTDGEILAVTATMGVTVGAPMEDIDIKGIEIAGLNRLPGLSWITVNPSGCVARVDVTERDAPPPILDLSTPSDMVAVRDGRILRVDALSGKSNVIAGEAVSAGTVLITGRVESETGTTLYRSYGEVWAETTRQLAVTVPLVYERQVPEGYTVFRPEVTFLCWRIPLYFSGKVDASFQIEVYRHFLTVGERTLPLGLTDTYYRRLKTERLARTRQQALELAQRQLIRQERTVFADCEYTETGREEQVRDGQLILTAVYRCEENIGIEAPLGPAPSPETAAGDEK